MDVSRARSSPGGSWTARSWTVMLAVASFVALGGAAVEATLWIRDARANRVIEAMLAGKEVRVAGNAAPDLRFAYAWSLRELDRSEEAVAAYGLLLTDAGDVSPGLRAAALYNLANIHLANGVDSAQKIEADRARNSIDLAKEIYRDALRLQPDHWDARYNLETAGYIAPDMPGVSIDDSRNAKPLESAWSEMRGFPSGLP